MTKLNSAEPLWVMTINLASGQEIKPHAHDHYYHMIYIMDGCYEIVVNGNKYVLCDNMMNISKLGETQSWVNVSNKTSISYEIKFSLMDDSMEFAIAALPDVIYGNMLYRALIERIINEKNCQYNNYPEYITLYLNTILYDLIRQNMNESPGDREQSHMRYSPAEIAKEYIQANYNMDISLETVAEGINFNKSYISTAFKEDEGITINEYIYKYRAFKACELIAYSDLLISDVSAMTGFKHIQHFNRVFKKYIGIPPGEYRNSQPAMLVKETQQDNPRFNSDVLAVRAGKRLEMDSDSGLWKKP